MNKPIPHIDTDGEVRELTAANLRAFKPAGEALPRTLQKPWVCARHGAPKKNGHYPKNTEPMMRNIDALMKQQVFQQPAPKP